MSDEDIADLTRRTADMVRRGVITEVIDGDIVKVRVRIGDLPTPPIPYSMALSSGNFQSRNLPKVGDAVTVTCESGDLRNGRATGANIGNIPVPAGEPDELVIIFANGTEFRYSQQQNLLSVILADGGKYIIKGEGTLDGPVTVTETLTVMKTLTVQQDIFGKANIYDAYGKMSDIRLTYNGHNHNETDSVTRQPNQLMPTTAS